MKALRMLVVFAPLIAVTPLWAATPGPQQLLASDDLRATLEIETAPPHYQRAPVVLAVEVATRRWFSRGTRVRTFRVPGAIVMPVSGFADNQTRRQDGATWSVQRWRFRLFAERRGDLALPPLRVFVSVNHDGATASEGELTLQHPPLQILTPPGAETAGDWLAASAFSVDEQWEGLRDSYRVGDAITRRRHLRASGAPGMMIPAREISAPEGLSLYAAPAQIEDSNARGVLLGQRLETLVITAEQPGDYALPATTYPWFDTTRGELRLATLPPFSFRVDGAGVTGDGPAPGSARTARTALVALVALVALAALLALGRRLRRPLRRAVAPLLRRWRGIRRLGTYLRAVARRDHLLALDSLYGQLQPRATEPGLRATVAGNASAARSLERLLHAAFAPDAGSTPLSWPEALTLWRALRRRRAAAAPELPLNPRSAAQ